MSDPGSKSPKPQSLGNLAPARFRKFSHRRLISTETENFGFST